MQKSHGKRFEHMATILILGGSSEGFELAERLAGMPGLEPLTSFAGRTASRRAVAGAHRVGGFGGPGGLAAYLAENRIAALIDATHPFAARISANAARAAQTAGVPCLHVCRPPWRPQPGDDWRMAADMDAAATLIPAGKKPVFLTIGRLGLAAFARRQDLRFIARVIDVPETTTAIAHVQLVRARGPFHLEAERDFLRQHDIGCLVTKNSGGAAAAPKLQAARERGLPVIMITPPPPPGGTCAASVNQALAWLENTLGFPVPGILRTKPT